MLIPHQQLSEAALRGLVRDFVTRDGTDYGTSEATLEQKVADVLRQLERREAAIDFDPATQSVNIVPARPGPS
ncbi:MAG TPA: YheU family protein [Myxococcales bacterium]